jgi:uncharacterized protein YprB with RNaseH-like and TPR domain
MSATADKFSRLAALKPARPIPARPATLRAPNEEDTIAQLLGAGVASNRFGEHLALRNWFSTPESTEPSPISLDLLSRTNNESFSRKTRAAIEDPAKWLFLDTETTGLAGGTGTYAFLVGVAWWDAGGLQVEQLFMRDFTEEYSLLCELAARVAERPVLVTFNGKSFDWPLLENRFTMTRSITAPKLAAHLDLLHPARALWRLRLGSVRLIELERRVLDAPRLGWHREDDVASALIPQYYFDYVRGGPAAPLAGVVRHNQMDLRGLAALFGKINTLLAQENSPSGEIDSRDLFGLSRFLQRRGESDRAHSACLQALSAGLPAEFRPKASRNLAYMAKRRGEHERAAEIWQAIVADPQDGIHACEQLAIHFERRAKDISRAKEFAQLALTMLRGRRGASRDPYASARLARLEQKFLHRLARLDNRTKAGGRTQSKRLLSHSNSLLI